MRTIGLIAAAVALAGVSAATEAAAPRLPYHPMVPTVPTVVTTQVAPPPGPAGAQFGRQINRRRWNGGQWSGGQWNGRQWAGSRPPAYRRPSRGWILPGYWINPGFGIGNYGDYGLAPPPSGYSWSRYYDDAVLIDREGRVYDWADDVDWDGARGGAGGDFGRDADRYDDGGPGPGPAPGAPVYSYDYDGVTVGGHSYHGTWTGSWNGSYDGAPPARYDGQFDGGYRGTVPGADYPPPPRGHRGHDGYGYGSAYAAGGWYYPAPTTTTIVIQSQPVVTTTSYVEEYEVARPVMRAKPKMIRKVRPRPRCACR